MEAAQSQHQLVCIPAPSYADPWSIVCADTLVNWNLRARTFGITFKRSAYMPIAVNYHFAREIILQLHD